jgi:hypothetical protein
MKTLQFVLLLSCLFAVPALAQPVCWEAESGGNGHYYEYVSTPDQANILWADARDLALEMGGYLATITSNEENVWVLENVVIPNDPTGLVGGPLLGGFQNHSSPEYSEPGGGWEWVTGEPWEFEAWGAGEPSAGVPGEDYLQYWRWSNLVWNDTMDSADPSTQFCFLVEYLPETVQSESVDWSSVKALYR